MKMFLISDNVDTYTGMRLAGVDGVVVHEREELRKALGGDPGPSRNRTEEGLYHILYHRSYRSQAIVRV